MPYPTTIPKLKHTLLSVEALHLEGGGDDDERTDGSSSSTVTALTSTDAVWDCIENNAGVAATAAAGAGGGTSNSTSSSSGGPPTVVCSLYSYEDSPEPALARSMMILGFVHRHRIGLVQAMIIKAKDNATSSATVGVKLADARHFRKLAPKDQINSKSFGRLMQRLRRTQTIAVIGQDKYQRFGLLVPMDEEGENVTGDGGGLTAADCAATIYIGTVQTVKQYILDRGVTDTALAAKKKTTTKKNNKKDGGSNNKWPVYRPDLNSDDDKDLDWPSYKPDHGSDDDDDDDEDDDNDFDNEDDFTAPKPQQNSDQEETSCGGQEEQVNVPWGSSFNVDANNNNYNNNSSTFETPAWAVTEANNYQAGDKRPLDAIMNNSGGDDNTDRFYQNEGAAAADKFYSGLTRNQNTAADSMLFHMRKMNNWVKSVQIKELNPNPISKQKLRVLDLACGKGGDLTKWTKHVRGMKFYLGVDVARGSLKDAAERARSLRQKGELHHAIFAAADLGADVLGQKQKLLTWSMQDEDKYETGEPNFRMVRGGGISDKERFDIVSIQFAIHYMMSSRQRARRFFHTVSQLLEMGGNLICTTIDARVVVGKLLDLGLNYHFKDGQDPDFQKAVVETGSGACKITFQPEIVKKILQSTPTSNNSNDEDMFGLEYTFTLVEGSDHEAGVGDAVNLPEWLTPIPVLEGLAKEAGLELEYAQNFHEFFYKRKDESENKDMLYKIGALNMNGTISLDEWSISGLYAALQFRKTAESSIIIDEPVAAAAGDEGEADEEEEELELDPAKVKALIPMALIKAKRTAGLEQWEKLTKEEKEALTQKELRKLAAK